MEQIIKIGLLCFMHLGVSIVRKQCPHFKRLARICSRKKNFATVNIDRNQRLGERFKVNNLPTLIMFSKGKMYLYRSQHRELSDLVKFADGGFSFQRPLSIPRDFTIIQVIWNIIYKDIIMTLYRMYIKAPMPTFLNLFIGMIIGAISMFLIMKVAMMQQLDDILNKQERKKNRRKLKKAKRKKDL